MSAGLEGLQKIITKLDELGSGRATKMLLEAFGAEALAQVNIGFSQGRDPYGNPWKAPKRGGQPMRDTGRLAQSFSMNVVGMTVKVGTNVVYAAPLQFGADFKPRTQVNRHAKSGKLISKKAASKRKSFVRISISKHGAHHLDARPMLPMGGDLGSIWGPALENAVRKAWRIFWGK